METIREHCKTCSDIKKCNKETESDEALAVNHKQKRR